MSSWTYVEGMIKVHIPGRTQPEIEFVLKSVLEHLPKVSGSEGGMEIYINKIDGWNESSSHDEFWKPSNLGTDEYGYFNIQTEYLITVNGSLRDTEYKEIIRTFVQWLTRLAKRIMVENVLVEIYDTFDENRYVIHDHDKFEQMYEDENNWNEYLFWKFTDEE